MGVHGIPEAVHADRGTSMTSKPVAQLLLDLGVDRSHYSSESARLAALPSWIHEYNHHRPHSAVGKKAPITRLDNLAGHHT